MKSLLEQLPAIVTDGKKEAERVMERAESNYRLGLQTRELVVPSRDAEAADMLRMADRARNDLNPADMNRLVYGDNLLAMAALLSGDDGQTGPRGKVGLAYIDPPFDSKADYRTNISILHDHIEQRPTAIEQLAYSDTWNEGTSSYLKMIVPRLYLIKELLSENGAIYVHLDWHVGAYVKIALDEIFGKENFVNEIVWRRAFAHNDPSRCGNIHDTLYYYQKSNERVWNKVFQKPSPEYIEQFFDQYDPVRKERYNRLPLDAPRHGDGGNLVYEWKGAWPAPGRTWACVKSQMEEYDRKGLIHYPKKEGGNPGSSVMKANSKASAFKTFGST